MAGFFIFDIETVVNQELFEKTATKKQKDRYMDPEDDYFLPVVFHVPVAVSILFTNNCDEPVVLPNGKPYFFESTVSREPEKIVERFFELFYRAIKRSSEENIITDTTRNNAPIHHPVLVSHNGLKFDLPVLYMWGIKKYESLSGLARDGLREFLNDRDSFENNRPNYTKRFSRFQLDTVELFPYSSLKSICYLYGIEVKTEMEGDGVEEFFREGKLHEIGRYCAEDVLSLARVVNMILRAKGENQLHLPDSHIEDCELRVV
ncbi:hypothetical protein [Persephonella sp.]|nr:hypothetical protein [Aquificota bacterium]